MAIKEYKLGDICHFKTGIDPIKSEMNGDIPFIKLGNTSGFEIDYKNSEKITSLRKEKAKLNDLLLCWSCSVGKSFIVKQTCFYSTAFYKLERKDNVYLNKYMHYLFIKNEKQINKLAVGSVLKKANMNILGNYILNLPDLQTQQEIINIIEPFENKKAKLLETRNYFQNLIKNIYFKSQSKKTIKISDVFEIKRNKKIDSKDVIELSSLNSYELFNSHFGNIDDFKTNIFSIKKHDIYISTIRPKLKKFGIAWKDSNILGTICVLSGNIQNISSLLGLLLQEDFIDKCILNSCGTKMPVLNKRWLIQNEFKKLNENEIDLIKKIINYVSNLSEQIFLLEKIINSLILLYII